MKVLFGLEYGYALQDIIEASTIEATRLGGDASRSNLHFADVMSQSMNPTKSCDGNGNHDDASRKIYRIGGLRWSLEQGRSVEDYSLFWIGSDNSAFANVVLTFNGCEIGAHRVILI